MKTNPETKARCVNDGHTSELDVGIPFLKGLYAGKCKTILSRVFGEDDWKYHVDFVVKLNNGQWIPIDWKSTPRDGNEWITLEWRNVNGQSGWLLGESKWIIFQMRDFVFRARRLDLVNFFMEHVNTKLIRSSKQYIRFDDTQYQAYTRDKWDREWDGKPNEDVMARVRVDDILQWNDLKGEKYQCNKYTYDGKRID